MENAKKIEESYNIDDYLISSEDYLTNEQENVYEIKYNDNVIGKIYEDDLKLYLKNSNKENEEIFVRLSESEEFKSIYSIAIFQRRKPQLIKSEELLETKDSKAEEDTYYILVKGQKEGPYTPSEVIDLISKKQILMTDLISSNAGHTWLKLYQVNEFERRKLKDSDHLPELPSSELFSKEHAPEMESKENDSEVDAVTGLLYLGNLKRGKIIEREKETLLETELTQKKSFSLVWKIILVTSIIGCIYFAIGMQKFLKSPFENPDNTVGEQAEMLTPVDEMTPNRPSQNFGDNYGRGAKIINRNLEPIKFRPPANRKSFLNNAKMNSQNEARFQENDDSSFYYDNNTNPIELDPVRSQVSRETSEEPMAVAEPAPAPANDPLFNQEINN